MPYDSIVLAKQVPDTKAVTGKAMNADGTVNRSALPAIFNPEDTNALEAALEVKDRFGGTVTVITMGPPQAAAILRESLYRAADRVILLTDRRAAASDTLATSYILSCACRKVSRYDLIFCGRQAIDGDTAQVGPQVAEKLGIPQITYVEKIERLDQDLIRCRRVTERGYEVVEANLPALLTVIATANDLRPASIKKMLRFKNARAPVEIALALEAGSDESQRAMIQEELLQLQTRGLAITQWNLDDLGADIAWCGRTGSPTKVKRIQSIVLTATEQKRYDPTDEGLSTLIHELIEDHTIG